MGPYPQIPSNSEPAEYLNQTCMDFNKIPLKRANTTEGEHIERDKNMMKLMQEQLELVRHAYEDKIKVHLK